MGVKRKYSCNDNAFTVDTEESFYWAGFIAADGCVHDHDGKYRYLSIGLGRKDKNIIIKLCQFLKSNHPIYDRIDKRGYLSSFVRITSTKIGMDLARFNIVPRKTHTLKFPKWLIHHKYVHHFIRGYFDGDGCVHISKRKKTYWGAISWGILGTKQFLTTIRTILQRECGLNKATIGQSNGIKSLNYGGTNIVKKIYDYIYKDSTIMLERKHDIMFKHFASIEAHRIELYNTREQKRVSIEKDKQDMIVKLNKKQQILDERNQYIIKLKHNGMRSAMIAKKFDMSIAMINIILSGDKELSKEKNYKLKKRNILKNKVIKMYNDGASKSHIARALNITRSTVVYYIKSY